MEIIMILVILAVLTLYAIAIVKITKTKFKTHSEKGLWFALVIFFPVAGSLVFLLWQQGRLR